MNGVTGQRQHRVRLAGPLALPVRALPIDPYVLGVWLGDGKARGGDFTKGAGDGQIADEIRGRGFEVREWSQSCPTVRSWNVIGLVTELKGAGLFGHKMIPDEYLRASEGQRLDLLRGLMDTDGTYNTARRGVCFTSTDKALAEGVRELALSLGERVHLAAVTRSGFGLTVESYDVKWVPRVHNPFTLERKASQVTVRAGGRNARRMITSVEPTVSVPTQCIAVDSSDRMYLVGDSMIPTHNTGDISYGGLKIAAQLATYARGKYYDHTVFPAVDVNDKKAWAAWKKVEYDAELAATAYEEMPADISRDWGIVINLRPGSGEATLYWVDLRLGWEAALMAKQLRALRSKGGKALTQFA